MYQVLFKFCEKNNNNISKRFVIVIVVLCVIANCTCHCVAQIVYVPYIVQSVREFEPESIQNQIYHNIIDSYHLAVVTVQQNKNSSICLTQNSDPQNSFM